MNWWSQAGSNRRPPACKAGALPAELWPPDLSFFRLAALRFSLSRSCADCTLPSSLNSRLARRKKSCVSAPIVIADSCVNTVLALDKSSIFRSSRWRFAPHSSLCKRSSNVEIRKMVGLGRFELPTSPLSGVRSNQLSYRPKVSLYLNDLELRSRAVVFIR